jgi:hypothetical protein
VVSLCYPCQLLPSFRTGKSFLSSIKSKKRFPASCRFLLFELLKLVLSWLVQTPVVPDDIQYVLSSTVRRFVNFRGEVPALRVLRCFGEVAKNADSAERLHTVSSKTSILNSSIRKNSAFKESLSCSFFHSSSKVIVALIVRR